MPRQSRLDAPGSLHHVMVQGIERGPIFRGAAAADFVVRLATLAEQEALTVYIRAFLPSHAHLLVRTGQRPLPRSMHTFLDGYAGAINRRHHRVGHLVPRKELGIEDGRKREWGRARGYKGRSGRSSRPTEILR